MLKKIRKGQRYTLPQLSKESGVPVRTIQYWETKGVEHGTVGKVKKVADVLDCTIEDLLGE